MSRLSVVLLATLLVATVPAQAQTTQGGPPASSGIVVGTTTITNNTPGDVLYDQNGVVGESSALTFNTSNGNLTSLTVNSPLTVTAGNNIVMSGSFNFVNPGSDAGFLGINGGNTSGNLVAGFYDSSYQGQPQQIFASSAVLGWSTATTTPGASWDISLSRIGAETLMLSNGISGTTSTKFVVSSVTDSLTSPTNYANAYLQAGINAGEFDLGSEHGGTGTALTKFALNADGTAIMDYAKTTAATLTLPTALIALPGIGSDSGHTDVAICMDTTTHALYYGSGAGGACAL